MTLTELIKTVKRLDSEMKSGPKVVEHVSPEVSNMAYHKMRMLGITALPKLAEIVSIQAEALERLGHRQEPESFVGDKAIGYLRCCEDIIKEAREALAKVQEVCDE